MDSLLIKTWSHTDTCLSRSLSWFRFRFRPGPASSESPSVCPAAASFSSPGTSGARGSPASLPGSLRRRRPRWRPAASSQRHQPCSHSLTLSHTLSHRAPEPQNPRASAAPAPLHLPLSFSGMHAGSVSNQAILTTYCALHRE